MKKWKLLNTTNVLQNKWMSVEKHTYQIGDKTDAYYKVKRPDFVVIIATDKAGNILVEKIYRWVVDSYVFEFPAGAIEKGETPIDAAKRELAEETGYTGEFKLLKNTLTIPSFFDCNVFFVESKITGRVEKKPEADEFIKTKFYTLPEIKEIINKNRNVDLIFISALKIFELNNVL